jgi:hypothetical protein
MSEAEDGIDIYEELGVAGWPETLDRDAAVDAMVAFYTIVGDVDNVQLIITSEFEKTVKEHLEPEWAAVFAQERGAYERVAGKTIPKADGSQVVVIEVGLFGVGNADPVPTVRHEAFHALMNRRGESLDTSREPVDNEDDLHPDIVAMAGIAAEEYRVERAVERQPTTLWDSFQALCVAAHDVIHDASAAYGRDHDVQAIWNKVMGAFSAMTVQAANVAAWLHCADRPMPALGNAELAARMLGESWPAVIESFRQLPPADVETPRKSLENAVMEIADRLDDWLADIGFRCLTSEGARLDSRVYENARWSARAPAAVRGADS